MKTPGTSGHIRYPLPDSVYERLALQTYTPILLHENVILALPPLYGKDHAIRYMWERTMDRLHVLESRAHLFQFGHVPLAFGSAKNHSQWIIQLLQTIGISLPSPTLDNLKSTLIRRIQSEDKHLVFFINIPETYPREDLEQFLDFAQQVYYFFPEAIHFIIALDQRWNEEDFISILAPYRSLCQHLIQPGLYSDTEVRHFIRYWSQKWHHPISQDIEERIIHESGGILLLAKAAIRILAQITSPTPPQLTRIFQSHPEYLLQLKLFAARLTDTQRIILTSLYTKPSHIHEKELEHMRAMNLIELTARGYRIRSKSLERYFHANTVSPAALFLLISEQIQLSAREQSLLKALLMDHGQILSRNHLAMLLSQNSDTCTDWSIDQAISRLRKKLLRTNFASFARIDTKKGKGFFITML